MTVPARRWLITKSTKNYVFLKLGAELASDATPKIDIVQGEKVEDMAGNETFGREVDRV